MNSAYVLILLFEFICQQRQFYFRICDDDQTKPHRTVQLQALTLMIRDYYDKFTYSLKQRGVRGTVFRIYSSYLKPYFQDKKDLSGIVTHYCGLQIAESPSGVSDNPAVSIIIPTYKGVEMTYQCIRSIADSHTDVPYEIIVADDHSEDGTEKLSELLPGVKVAVTEKNLGFTLNCNNASKHARGKYLFFLNNDTLVIGDWLRPSVDMMEASPDTGIVGSKLLYPDGSLQEAGCIVWKDGSACNWGNGMDPSDPEYCYVRDVDYASGAAILVKKDLFDALGGFDPRYAPAYCEDSDLAFGIRKLGKIVRYQPFSEVIHFEGMSNGRRIDSGIKHYQAVNTEKFRDKWRCTLEEENLPEGERAFQARERACHRKTILFIDSGIPRFDDNAGNRTVYDYIRVLCRMGYCVKFIPDDFSYDPVYTPIYQKMGVEVLYGRKYVFGWKKWISDNGYAIDHVMIFRPENAEKYLDFIKKNTKAAVHYNLADLHCLRLRREYEITGDEARLRESERMRKKEQKQMHDADRGITVSCDEAKILEGEFGLKDVSVFPIFCYDRPDIGHRDYAGQKDIMFVGSFNHRPNADAMRWFLGEIFPKILSELPDVRLHIIGSNAPDDLMSQASDHVIFHSHLPDSELDAFYRSTAVCVVPLRYGAGVKGKAVEALRMKIPLVSTSVGLEGLMDIGDYISAFDDAESFAKEVVRLYTDRAAAEAESVRHSEYVGRYFSVAGAEECFEKEFGSCRK